MAETHESSAASSSLFVSGASTATSDSEISTASAAAASWFSSTTLEQDSASCAMSGAFGAAAATSGASIGALGAAAGGAFSSLASTLPPWPLVETVPPKTSTFADAMGTSDRTTFNEDDPGGLLSCDDLMRRRVASFSRKRPPPPPFFLVNFILFYAASFSPKASLSINCPSSYRGVLSDFGFMVGSSHSRGLSLQLLLVAALSPLPTLKVRYRTVAPPRVLFFFLAISTPRSDARREAVLGLRQLAISTPN